MPNINEICHTPLCISTCQILTNCFLSPRYFSKICACKNHICCASIYRDDNVILRGKKISCDVHIISIKVWYRKYTCEKSRMYAYIRKKSHIWLKPFSITFEPVMIAKIPGRHIKDIFLLTVGEREKYDPRITRPKLMRLL